MQKKIPVRQCLGCREHKPKKEMMRIVRSPEGTLSLDLKGKASGRGAYLCPQAECLNRARRSRALERALECEIPEEVYQALEAQMDEARNELEKPEISG